MILFQGFRERRTAETLRKVLVQLKTLTDSEMKILSIDRPDRLYDARRLIRVSKEELDTMEEIIDNKIKKLYVMANTRISIK
jgi:hypothetical protein